MPSNTGHGLTGRITPLEQPPTEAGQTRARAASRAVAIITHIHPPGERPRDPGLLAVIGKSAEKFPRNDAHDASGPNVFWRRGRVRSRLLWLEELPIVPARTTFIRFALVSILIAGSALAPLAALAAPRHSRFLLGAYRKTMEIEPEMTRACQTWGVPLKLARAVCMYESGGNDGLTSGAGAHGYFQVMPATHRLMGVETNIEAGIKYLGEMIQRTGREDDALAAYNAGPGRLASGRTLPMETLQYVVGVGQLRSLLLQGEEALRAEASALQLHRVTDGEEWMDVCDATKTSLIELRLYNPYNANRPLRAGQLIAYPAEPAASISELLVPVPDKGGWSYTTLPGDLYHHLAIAFGVSYDRMREDNDLWRVQVPLSGVPLLVRPDAGPVLAGVHVVVQGESIRSIAAEQGLDPWAIIRDNGLWDQTIEPGRVLRMPGSADPVVLASILPGAQPAAPAASAVSAVPSPRAADPPPAKRPPAPRVHKVQRGETLTLIAKTYGTTVEILRELNGLRGSRLVIGQRLRVPAVAS